MVERLGLPPWSEIAEKIKSYLWGWVDNIARFWASQAYGFGKTLWQIQQELRPFIDGLIAGSLEKFKEAHSILNYTYSQLQNAWEGAIDRLRQLVETDILNIWSHIDELTIQIWQKFGEFYTEIMEDIFGAGGRINVWFDLQKEKILTWLFPEHKDPNKWFDSKGMVVLGWIEGAEVWFVNLVAKLFEKILDRLVEMEEEEK